MNPRIWITVGALLGALGVAMGAFHAHGLEGYLKDRVSDPDELTRRMANTATGVRYQMYHALALVLVGLLALRGRHWGLDLAGGLFVMGVVLFSGLLYGITLSGVKWLGMIVMLGGISLILGWIVLAISAWQTGES